MQNNLTRTSYDLVILQKGKMVLVSKVEIIDISLGGVALKADRQLDPDKEYMIRLGYAEQSVNVNCTLVRSSISGTGTGPGGEKTPTYAVGMKFMENQTDKIAAFLAAFELRKKDDMSPATDRRLHARFQIIAPQKKAMLFPENFTVKDINLNSTFRQAGYPDAFSAMWTHVVHTSSGIFWYNVQTGAGVIGRLDIAGNLTPFKIHPAGSFSTGWTHILDTPKGLLWYNAQTGAGVIGRFDSAGNHDTVKAYPAGSFSTGWTNVVNTPDGILWYNAKTGASVIVRID